MLTAALSFLAVAAPLFTVDPNVGDPVALTTVTEDHWRTLTTLYDVATGGRNDTAPRSGIHIVASRDLRSNEAGRSRYGRVELRSTGAITPELLTALRHELAHQFLWSVCPAAADDKLFHETFALATSGELASWDANYVTTSEAARTLELTRNLDGPKARQALARLVRESMTAQMQAPRAVTARLARCTGAAPWRPMEVYELATAERAYADAFVVIHRASGEIIVAEGGAELAMPFGSVLKPFIVAGATTTPTIAPVRGDNNWLCGRGMPERLTANDALARSCNGYFLAWGAKDPNIVRYGVYGPMLQELGLARLPENIGEATGLTPSLALTPRAVAEAYRALADAPVLRALEDTPRHGTLQGLGLTGAFKTGTVRDPQSRPLVGWLVQVTDRLVAVSVVVGKQPRDFAQASARRLAAASTRLVDKPAAVQTFGLVGASQVSLRCPGVAMRGPRHDGQAQVAIRLDDALTDGPLVCLGAPWMVKVGGPGQAPSNDERPYAGVFTQVAFDDHAPVADSTASRRALRARRGSDVIFTTSLGAYVAGVTRDEAGPFGGAVREALVRVIAHNVYEPRHDGRPICDTTHCQVFKGTAHLGSEDARSVARGLPYHGWLPFALGGDAAWEKRIAAHEVARVLGANPTHLEFENGEATYIRTIEGPADERVRVPCEVVRNALHLPACPDSVLPDGGLWTFAGRGEGHAAGLNLLDARSSNSTADSLLSAAYGHTPR